MPIGHARLLRGDKPDCELSPGPWRAIYPWRGTLTVRPARRPDEDLAAGRGRALGKSAWRVVNHDPQACYFVWELSGTQEPLASPTKGLSELLAYDMPRLPGDRDDGAATVRFERVDLKPGVVTPRHTHRGSGLRVLISGRLEAEIDDSRFTLGPGDCWLEKGPGEAVIGRAAAGEHTAFVRLLVLPENCLDQDSFVFLDDGEENRPKPAFYERIHEERVVL